MKFLLAMGALILAGGAGYFWLSGQGSGEETAFASEVKQKLEAYQKINELSPNLSVFDDALFQALRSTERIPVASGTSTIRSGRDNPFLPF